MKAVFPSNSDLGLKGSVYGHFGSAPFFVLVDTESSEYEIKVNEDKDHLHGHCQPLKALGGLKADAVIVGGIGKGALSKLLATGTKVYRAVEGTVQTNLELLKSGSLPDFTLAHTCAGHDIDGNCAH